MTGPPATRRSAGLLLATLAMMGATACGSSDTAFTPGASVNPDTNNVFATLMQRPDIDQAARQYHQMIDEIRRALSQAIPTLAAWRQEGEASNASCAGDYPGIDFDGQTRTLPYDVVSGNLPDAE
jgi:hypothetical protein